MLHVYDNLTFLYKFSLQELDETQSSWTNYTNIDLLPKIENTVQKFDIENSKWIYVEKPSEPGVTESIFEKILTYEDARLRDYPKIEDYIDGIVKSNDAQVSQYIDKCNEVKAMWAKDMEPVTLREYYKIKGIEIQKI